MSQEILVDDVAFISGLKWDAVMNVAAEKSEIASFARDKGARYYVRMSNESDVRVGFYVAEKGEKVRGRYSLAGAFAMVEDVSAESLLFLDCTNTLGNDLCVVVGLRNGLPFPGFDKCGTRVDMMKVAADFISLNSKGVHIYSNTRAFPTVTRFDLEDLIHAQLSKARIQVLRNYAWVQPALLGLVMLAILGGWLWWDSIEKAEAAKRRAKQQVDPNVAYAQALPAALAQAGVPAASVGKEVYTRLGQVPITQGGWNLAEAKCEAAGCVLTWESTGLGTFESFIRMSGNKDITPGLDNGRNLSSGLAYEAPVTPLKQEDIVPFRDFMVTTGSRFQRWAIGGWKFSFGEPTPYGVPPGITATQIKDPIKVGEWRGSAKYWALDSLLELPPNMTATKITVRRDANGFVFTCEGKYYVK